jgi:cytochrome oxidase assembly protein ShyY1
MIVAMLGAGVWQLQRLGERRDDNARIAAVRDLDPVEVDEAADLAGLEDHTPVLIGGTYRSDREILVANRAVEGQAGFWRVTPLELPDGSAVAVVRGFVPRRLPVGTTEAEVAAPAGPVVVEGRAFDSVPRGLVAVVDQGETPQVTRMDLDAVREASGVEVADRWVRLRAQDPAQEVPAPVPDEDLNDGPHLSYAFQWFFFSTGTVVVYALILRRALRRPWHDGPAGGVPAADGPADLDRKAPHADLRTGPHGDGHAVRARR